VFAYEESEKYKEGKFIIERAHTLKIQFRKPVKADVTVPSRA
jgi:hypothetical protein